MWLFFVQFLSILSGYIQEVQKKGLALGFRQEKTAGKINSLKISAFADVA